MMKYIEADNINEYLKFNPWTGHREYVYDLVKRLEPHNIVELGSHYGCSLFTMAQCVKDNNLDCEIYAVDTWEGTGEIGAYDNTVYETVIKTRDQCYSTVNIKLMKMFFEDARKELVKDLNKKIDILHIDGSHEYENVKQDFETWIDLMNEHGVILFHDIGIKTNQGSEVYWSEIKRKYQYTIEFDYSWGLGIVFLNEQEYIKASELLKNKDYQNIENRRADEVGHKLADYYFEINNRSKYIKDLERWNEEKTVHLEGWEKVVKEKDNYIVRLQNEKQELNDDLKRWEENVKGKELYIKQLQSEKQELDSHLRNWEENAKGKELYIGQLQSEKQELNSYLKDWEENVREKDLYIQELENENKKLNDVLSKQQEIEENNLIQEFKDLLQKKESHIEELEKTKKELKRHLDGWEKVVSGKDSYIDELLKQREELNVEIQAWEKNSQGKENYIAELEKDKQLILENFNASQRYIEQLQKEHEEIKKMPFFKKIRFIIGGNR